MKNKAFELASYVFSKDEPILLDTNVWLYLFPAPSDPNTAPAGYSAALKEMLTAGVHLASDAITISEYLGSYWRIEYKGAYQKKYGKLKAFRKSPDFAAIGASASLFAQKILKLCSRHDYPFASIDVDQVLSNFESGVMDINDGLLVESCRHNGWKFVTHDEDCTEGGIEVLTVNPKLIAACP